MMTALWDVQIESGAKEFGIKSHPENWPTFACLVNIDEAFQDCLDLRKKPLTETELLITKGRQAELFSAAGQLVRQEAVGLHMDAFQAFWRANWRSYMKAWLNSERSYWNARIAELTDEVLSKYCAEEATEFRGHLEAVDLIDSFVDMS